MTAHLSIFIRRSADDVYRFVRDARQLPRWAAGLAASVEPDGDAWKVQTPVGPATLRFADDNPWGILDHTVTLAGNDPPLQFRVPLRAIATADGCELLFTLLRIPGMSDAQFDDDRQTVQRDLAALKSLLEHAS